MSSHRSTSSKATERTALLEAVNDQPFRHRDESPNEIIGDNELLGNDINDNDFDLMLSKSVSYSSGLGLEPESQTRSMLQGPRKYSSRGSRRPSFASVTRSISRGSHGVDEETIEEAVEEEEDSESKSPFLGGVSVFRFWLIFGVILANYFVACFDSTIMASSHPVITSYFNSSNSASWLSTAFLLTSTAFQPLFGRLSDTIGRKGPYIFTLFVFLISTVWCGVAQSMTSFILARALCGLGAGGMMVMGSIITSDLVPIEIRGAYQSYINIVFGVGSSLGAATGGAIADSLGWRWEFGIQVPFILLCVILAMITTPSDLGLGEGVTKQGLWGAMKVFDIKGSLLLTVSITCLILGLNLGGNIYPWSHPIVITVLVIFGVGAPLFIYVESTVELPIMPLKLIRHNPRAGLIFSNFLAAVLVNAILFNVPLYFQAVLLESATSSGLRLVIPSLCASSVGTATGFLITYTRRLKAPLVAGAILILIGTICLSCLRRGLPNWVYLLFLVPSSMGQGFQFPGTFMGILAVSEQKEQAVVTSTLILWRSLGMVLGVASSSLVLQNALYSYLEELVTGPDKQKVIEGVRKSVQSIVTLPSEYREQVIESYEAALHLTFLTAVGLAVIMVLVILPVRMPRLGKRS